MKRATLLSHAKVLPEGVKQGVRDDRTDQVHLRELEPTIGMRAPMVSDTPESSLSVTRRHSV